MNLSQELLSTVILYTLASEVWDYLEEHYEGKRQYIMVQLLGDIFRCTFLDTVSMENQLSQRYQKVHRLKVLRHDLKDSLIAAVMVMSLPDSYALLQQHLYIKKKSKLTTEFVTKQILMEENSHGNASHVALMGDGKGKKPSQGPSTDSDAK